MPSHFFRLDFQHLFFSILEEGSKRVYFFQIFPSEYSESDIRRGRLDSHQRRTKQTKKNRKATTGRWTNEVSHGRYPASIRPPYPYFPLPYVELNKELNKKILIYPDSRDFQIIDYRFRVYSPPSWKNEIIQFSQFFRVVKRKKEKNCCQFRF